ncbi:hypothetical protein GCM10009554_42440 [Kribbella koreensis]|jgi:hypothetical protein
MLVPEGSEVRMAEYELQQFEVSRTETRGAVRRLLTEHAEYGGWELARLRRYPDGTRRVWLRRRIIKVMRTL